MTDALLFAMLNVSPITAVVGTSIACQRLPENSTFPAIVYSEISCVPYINFCAPSSRFTSRVQINPLAKTMAQIEALHALIKTALESDTARTFGLINVLNCRFSARTAASIDDDTGIWTKPADYMLVYQ